MCRTHFPRIARATNSCTRGMNQCTQCVGWRRRDRGKSSQREGNALFDDFWYFSSLKSTIKEKFLYDSIRRQQVLPCLGDADRVRLRESVNSRPTHKAQAQPTDKTKDMLSIPSAQVLESRPPTLLCGRAGNACTNLLGFFV